jgi:hypothetical protein
MENTWPNEGKYVRECKNDKRHGQRDYTFASGSQYVGEWKEGKPWEGTQYDKDGNVTYTNSDGVDKPVN